jgi:predicted nucleic-acid-binding Zn-ribbon protein
MGRRGYGGFSAEKCLNQNFQNERIKRMGKEKEKFFE